MLDRRAEFVRSPNTTVLNKFLKLLVKWGKGGFRPMNDSTRVFTQSLKLGVNESFRRPKNFVSYRLCFLLNSDSPRENGDDRLAAAMPAMKCSCRIVLCCCL